jgi:beta-fructofuranosidase
MRSPREQTETAVQAAVAKAEMDPARPVYHFRSPAQWMNDPNGPIFYNGWYHLFYQFNPHGDQWDHMHWGHARSRDLVRWEHLPIALFPSLESGETHCYSGSCAITGNGTPMIFYTSIGDREPEQRAAVPEDEDLINWRKRDAPVLTQADNLLGGGPKVLSWRDPFLFRCGTRTFMVVGGSVDKQHGCVMLYQANDAQLTHWVRQSLLHQESGNIECPLFFQLKDKWVLVFSINNRAKYHVGAFNADTGTFISEQQGWIDHGQAFYAPQAFEDGHGQMILIGWIRGWNAGRGWNGCFSLPRQLTLGPDDKLLQTPIAATQTLWQNEAVESDFVLSGHRRLDLPGDAVCLSMRFASNLAGQIGFHVCVSGDSERKLQIAYQQGQLSVGDIKCAVPHDSGPFIELTVLLDRSVIEVFAQNGFACITKVLNPYHAGDTGIEVFADRPTKVDELRTRTVNSIW